MEGGGIKIWWGDFSISGEISKFSVGWGWLVYHNAAFEISWNDRVLLRSLLILAISGQSIKFWINFSWLEEFCLSQFTILIWYMSISIQLYVIKPLELQGWATSVGLKMMKANSKFQDLHTTFEMMIILFSPSYRRWGGTLLIILAR